MFPATGCGRHAHLLLLPFERLVIAVSYSAAACHALSVCVLLAIAMLSCLFHVLAISAVLLSKMCLHAELGLCMVSWPDLSSACWVLGQRPKRLKCSHMVKSLGHPLASPVPTPCQVYLGPLPIGQHPTLLVELIGIMCGRREVHPVRTTTRLAVVATDVNSNVCQLVDF